VGQVGEEMAADYLQRTGYEILARNWRSPDATVPGELDIVARSAEILVVCEVKTRTTPLYGSPAEAVTPEKAARLRALAAVWLREQRYRAGRAAVPVRSCRIDVLGVVRTRDGAVLLQHLPGAC
jgi:putative endonuclease